MTDKDMNILALRKTKKVYRDGDAVIKIFYDGTSKADVINEALIHARIEETGLNVPELLDIVPIDGHWAICTRYIEGKTLYQHFKDKSMPIDELLNYFVDLHMLVQTKTSPLLNKLKDKMTRQIKNAAIDAETMTELLTTLEGMPNKNVVCHGDFNLSNIIISNDGTPFILDWSHTTQGTATADVAQSYLLFCLNGAFEFANKYLDLYAEKSSVPKRYVQKWLPIVAAARLSKAIPEESEFLLSWVNVAEVDDN